MSDFLNIGQIVNVHGIQGEVKIYPLTDDMTRFEKLKTVLIEINKELKNFNIEDIKYLKNTVILKLEGVDTIEKAQSLRNKYVQIDRKDAVKLPKDSYFICDLIGIDIYECNGNYLGKIQDVTQTGSNDVYIVKNGEKEILIPALKEIFKLVDMEGRRMEVELPEGLV